MTTTNVHSFAEESCWDGENFRSIRREVVFVVEGHAIVTGRRIRHEFVADFGLWYDYEDEVLMSILNEEVPDVDWGWYVFHKLTDHSAIRIYNPDDGKIVGSIRVRGRPNRKLSGEITAANITPIAQGRVYQEVRRVTDVGTEDSTET